MESQVAKNNSSTYIALFSIIIIAGVSYFLINPFLTSLKETTVKLDAKTQEVNETQNKINTLNSLSTQFAQASDTVKKMGLAAPSSDEMPEILVQIDTMAKSSGLQVSSVQPSKEVSAGVVPVTVTLQGDYKGFTAFLNKLENNIRPMNIKLLNIASAVKAEGNVINFTLNLDILKVGGSNESK